MPDRPPDRRAATPRASTAVSARQLAVLFTGVAAVAWAAPLIRLAGPAPALLIAAIRLGTAAPPMTALAFATRRHEVLRLSRRDLVLLGVSGLALAGHFAAWVAAVQQTSIISGVVLVTMQPIFVAIGAWLVLRERPTNAVLAGIAIAIGGAVVLAGHDAIGVGERAGSLRGDLLALLGAVFSSVYLVIGRGARVCLSMRAYTGVVYAVTATVLALAVVVTGTPVLGHAREAYLYAMLLGLVPQLIGHNAINWSLGYMPAAIVAIAILGEPAGATLLGVAILDERPGALEVLGGAIVLAGVYVALRWTRGGEASTMRAGDEAVGDITTAGARHDARHQGGRND